MTVHLADQQCPTLTKKEKGGKKMSETKDFKKGNGERPETGNNDDTEEVEGYGYCTTHKQKCLNDCIGGGPAISHID